MQLMLKGPGAKRLKLRCDTLLSSFAFNFNLRRYKMEAVGGRLEHETEAVEKLTLKVGRCRLTLSNPR